MAVAMTVIGAMTLAMVLAGATIMTLMILEPGRKR